MKSYYSLNSERHVFTLNPFFVIPNEVRSLVFMLKINAVNHLSFKKIEILYLNIVRISIQSYRIHISPSIHFLKTILDTLLELQHK
jgi:hypothetical protein